MSTFKGIIDEFPDIRIDYFRQSKDPNARAPLACFLTHIHSDHIQGLDAFYGGPFIHCSAATKELLLRLERRTHRWNHAKGVLESRKCQYAEKKTKLKVIPLETPTVVELSSEKSIRVTLFDANHCPGAVMFLIEGDGKAVLYTGDIRAEPWWVDYLSRHPILIPYTTSIKHLNKIYLDTTFATRKKTHQLFSPKREGISELIEKVSKYPKDTTFHFNTWTFGYEDVWVALAAAFDTKIHLSDYHFRLFHFIRNPETYAQGPYLKGYKFGNSEVPGCLTRNPEARFHSCERKQGCQGLEGKKNIVWITPIITRMGDYEVHEAGSGDLESQDDLVLHEDHLQLLMEGLGPNVDLRVKELLESARNTRKQALPLDLLTGAEDLGLVGLVDVLSRAVDSSQGDADFARNDLIKNATIQADNGELLPNKVTFPYSRHSSHSELRGLVSIFRPLDIYPCVVEDETWDESKTMEYLFGDLCMGNEFIHDREMRSKVDGARRLQESLEEERTKFEMESQIMQDRTQDGILPVFDLEITKERLMVKREEERLEAWAKVKALGSSTASCSPVPSRPTTPRPTTPCLATPRLLKRPITDDSDDDVTPKARKLNPPVAELSSSPPLPPLLDPGIGFHLSNLTPLEAARLAGSSTASSSPQISPIRPLPSRPTGKDLNSMKKTIAPPKILLTPKRIKIEEHASSSVQGVFFDALEKTETTPRASLVSSHTLRCETKLPLARTFRRRQRSPILSLAVGVDQELELSNDNVDQEEVLEAMKAALGIGGKSWWDVELTCTEKKWRAVEETEL